MTEKTWNPDGKKAPMSSSSSAGKGRKYAEDSTKGGITKAGPKGGMGIKERATGTTKSTKPKFTMAELLRMMPVDTLEEAILKVYGPNAPERTGANGEKLPKGMAKGGMAKKKKK